MENTHFDDMPTPKQLATAERLKDQFLNTQLLNNFSLMIQLDYIGNNIKQKCFFFFFFPSNLGMIFQFELSHLVNLLNYKEIA